VLYKEVDLHLAAVESSLIALAQHRNLVERLKETRYVLEGLPLIAAELKSFYLGVAVYDPSNSVAAFYCVSKKGVPSVLPSLTRQLQHFTRKILKFFMQSHIADCDSQPIDLIQGAVTCESSLTGDNVLDD
jgi:hypothetical protein